MENGDIHENQPMSVHKKYDHLIHIVFKQKNKWISLYRNCCVKLSHITYKNASNKKLSICSRTIITIKITA
jgi:hypothetical protein